MEKRWILTGIGISGIILIILFSLYWLYQKAEIPEEMLLNIKEAEISLEKNGITNTAGTYPKYEKISADYYYTYNHCLEALKTASQKLNGVIEIKHAEKLKNIKNDLIQSLDVKDEVNEVKLPILVLRGKAELYDYKNEQVALDSSFETLIFGISACSDTILIQNICSILKNQPELCSKNPSFVENTQEEKFKPTDSLCYDSCNIQHLTNNKFVSLLWQGPPCSRIEGYEEGKSAAKARYCHEKSCKSNQDDKGCCKSAECVEQGKCYKANTAKDVDADGRIEICSTINDVDAWLDPDLNYQACSNAGFSWVNNKKEDGLCCGDDKGEHAYKCKGKICSKEDDFACCPADSCVLNGKCYESGCSQIELENKEKIKVFCDAASNSWLDLDKSHCSECLGKKAWSGTVCCGDDIGEGKYPIRFAVSDKNETSKIAYHICSTQKSDCVHPNREAPFSEGIYVFNENSQYLKGGYYCENSQWHNLDSSSKYCKEGGYNYDENKKICCGDNTNEYYIIGSDSTSACCSLPTEIVANTMCHETTLCGNDILNNGEQCELPATQNNPYCEQPQQDCSGKKSGVRGANGYCNSNCLCEESKFEYVCQKNSCGAECGNDNDCIKENKCDLSSCSCKPKTYCGDKIVQRYNDFAQKEECEPPNTKDSAYCKIEQCKGKKSISTGIINILNSNSTEYGICTDNCECSYGSIDYSCRKNACGAECNQDGNGCSDGMICNTDSCACYASFVCGNGLCEQGEKESCPSDCRKGACPYRIDLRLNKASYNYSDVVSVEITAYDENNNPLPQVRFELDTSVNDVIVGSSLYTTSLSGTYFITKKVTNSAASGTHKYIVRSKGEGCATVSDAEVIYVHANNPYTIPPVEINYSRFEFITDTFNITREKLPAARCGDFIIGIGEACEGNSICRPSFGCDYKNKVYDFAEQCSNCNCPAEQKSEPNDESYCANCNSCGDGLVNCGEECENGTLNAGLACRNGMLYNKIDSCQSCRWGDDEALNDVLVDICQCKCPKNPEFNCVNGNYINYTLDYNAGCADGKCNPCNCIDTYIKDSNNDGIEDKCSYELCGNKIDDNDNGLVNEESCIWYYCSQCGYGLFNFCTRQECNKFEEGCFFRSFGFNSFNILSSIDGAGICGACSGAKRCEDYEADNTTCNSDPCSIGNCVWQKKQCCTDSDDDNACDSNDNCIGISNPGQEDSDKDGKGNACELCANEPLLLEPTEQKESKCNDLIDNDCDSLADCKDADCAGKSDCCQTEKDCTQSDCAIESCTSNKCEYKPRYLCDNTECSNGYYCDVDGVCKKPDLSSDVCLYCTADATINDYGIGYGNLFNQFGDAVNNLCCGDQENEYYVVQKENFQSACCNSSTSCVDSQGKCQSSNSPYYENHNFHCFINLWYECSSNRNVLCAEAGHNYKLNLSYQLNHETGWYCVFDGLSFGWRQTYPNEICSDGIDNDCDKKIDFVDEECKSSAKIRQ